MISSSGGVPHRGLVKDFTTPKVELSNSLRCDSIWNYYNSNNNDNYNFDNNSDDDVKEMRCYVLNMMNK